jgi:hypothetical protein
MTVLWMMMWLSGSGFDEEEAGMLMDEVVLMLKMQCSVEIWTSWLQWAVIRETRDGGTCPVAEAKQVIKRS